jgi:hypothetical protein
MVYRVPTKPPRGPVEEVPLRHDEKFWWKFMWLADDCNIGVETVKQGPAWALWAVMMLKHTKMFPEYYKDGAE